MWVVAVVAAVVVVVAVVAALAVARSVVVVIVVVVHASATAAAVAPPKESGFTFAIPSNTDTRYAVISSGPSTPSPLASYWPNCGVVREKREGRGGEGPRVGNLVLVRDGWRNIFVSGRGWPSEQAGGGRRGVGGRGASWYNQSLCGMGVRACIVRGWFMAG